MDKPISVMIQEMKNDVLNTITRHNIHPSITRLVLGDIYREICAVADSQYLQERDAYERADSSKEKKDSSKEKADKK